MYDVQIERLKDDMISFVLRQMKKYVVEENYEVQQRYDNVMMICRQCFKYEDHSMKENLKGMIFELNDDLQEGNAIREHRRYEYIVRENSRISEEMLLTSLEQRYDTTNIDINLDAELIVLFRQIWLSGKTTPVVINALSDFIARSDRFVIAMVSYAIMLRCVRSYDRGLTRLLMEMQTPEAYCALAMITLRHAPRIVYDKTQRDVFVEFLAENGHREHFIHTLELIIKSYETGLIAEEFEKNIYPEVVRKRADLNIDSIIDQGKNPDWEGLLEGSPLMDKMRKINDMQLKGKDVNYATFKAMKGYPFFSDTAHWFYPFTVRYREICTINGLGEKEIEYISRVANICDSDRYSLFMMFKSMNMSNVESILGNLGAGKMDELKDMLDDDLKNAEEVKFSLCQRYSVMNIYRFYNLAPNHTDFDSPFKIGFKKSSLDALRELLSVDSVLRIANAAFQAKDYKTAIALYGSSAEEMIDSDIHVFQKIGYCYEQLKEYSAAIEYYDKSDVLLPDDNWTLRRLVLCHDHIEGHSATCIKLYRRLIDKNPDDDTLIKPLASHLYGQGLYEEANTLLYKLEYRLPGFYVWEMLARSLSLSGKYSDAGKFFQKACQSSDAEPYTFVCSAVNGIISGEGNAENLLDQAYGIENDAESFLEFFQREYVSGIISQFTQQQRDNLTNTINKIIIQS